MRALAIPARPSAAPPRTGRHGGESDLAGEATRGGGGVNFNPPVRVGFSCVRLVCSSRETTVPHRAGWMSDRRMAVESVELPVPRSGEQDLQGWCSRCGGPPRTWVRGGPRCGGSALLERCENIGRGGPIQQRRVMPIPPAAGVGVGGRVRRGLRNGHNVRGPHVAGIGHAGQPDGRTGDDAGGDGGQGDVAGEATRDGGVNFNPPVRVGFSCVRLVCSSRETTVPPRAGNVCPPNGGRSG